MNKPYRRMVAQEDYLDDAESLRAYSYDASGFSALPAAIVKPQTIDQLRRIILHANQHRVPLVPRGGGTGTRAGAICEGATIVDMRNFATLEKLDRQLSTITVGAGTPIARLNQTLVSYGYHLPLRPHSPYATVGGLVAQNAVSIFSFRYGDMTELVQEVECFDGLGRFALLKGKDVEKAVGKEGTTAIITKVKIKVAPVSKYTLGVVEVEDVTEALAEAQHLSDETLVGIEYCNSLVSEVIGLGEGKHLLCIYASQSGQLKDEEKVKEILSKRERISELLWSEGFTVIEGATFDAQSIDKFSQYCERHKLPCYGHLGLGILFTQLHNTADRSQFWNTVVSLGGIPAAGEGFGRLATTYLPEQIRRAVRVLKEERDYNEILNPGVLLQMKKATNKQEFIADSVRKAIFAQENDAYLVTRDMRLSNRHVTYLLSKGLTSPWLYRVPVYNRSTADDEILEMRSRMVARGVETAANKEMILKIRAGKNAFR